MVKTFIDLLKSSVLTQWTITVIVLGIYAGLLFTGKPVPTMVENLVMLVAAFYFGSKVGYLQGVNSNQSLMKG